jgi:hypothetical protein
VAYRIVDYFFWYRDFLSFGFLQRTANYCTAQKNIILHFDNLFFGWDILCPYNFRARGLSAFFKGLKAPLFYRYVLVFSFSYGFYFVARNGHKA